jgi:hypothetical protein
MYLHSFSFPALLAAAALAAMPLSADTLLVSTFSSQTPSFETDTGNSWTIGGPGNVEIGVGFQDPSNTLSYTLTQLQVAANFFTVNPDATSNPSLNDLNLAIWENTANDLNTATQLQSWSVAAPPVAGTGGQIFSVTSALTTIIDPTHFYFITETVTPDGANTAVWGAQENNLTPMQIGYYAGVYGTPGSWGVADTPCTNDPCTASNDPSASGTPAFSVSGNVLTATTPEPRSYAALLAAILFGALAVRRRSTVTVR